MVELGQVRHGHVQVTHGRGLGRQVQRCGAHGLRRALPQAQEDRFDVVARFGLTAGDGVLHHGGRVLGQQLHDAAVVLDAAAAPVLLLQVGAQLAKERRQLPALEDRGMVQRRRLALERRQVVVRIEALLVRAVRARMPGKLLAVGPHERDVLHVALDRHGLEGGRARRAVAIAVEAHRLVLVHLGRLEDARIEGAGRQ